VSAVAEYRVDGHVFRQPFTARVWSSDELAAELHDAGFSDVRPISPKWTAARLAD